MKKSKAKTKSASKAQARVRSIDHALEQEGSTGKKTQINVGLLIINRYDRLTGVQAETGGDPINVYSTQLGQPATQIAHQPASSGHVSQTSTSFNQPVASVDPRMPVKANSLSYDPFRQVPGALPPQKLKVRKQTVKDTKKYSVTNDEDLQLLAAYDEFPHKTQGEIKMMLKKQDNLKRRKAALEEKRIAENKMLEDEDDATEGIKKKAKLDRLGATVQKKRVDANKSSDDTNNDDDDDTADVEQPDSSLSPEKDAEVTPKQQLPYFRENFRGLTQFGEAQPANSVLQCLATLPKLAHLYKNKADGSVNPDGLDEFDSPKEDKSM